MRRKVGRGRREKRSARRDDSFADQLSQLKLYLSASWPSSYRCTTMHCLCEHARRGLWWGPGTSLSQELRAAALGVTLRQLVHISQKVSDGSCPGASVLCFAERLTRLSECRASVAHPTSRSLETLGDEKQRASSSRAPTRPIPIAQAIADLLLSFRHRFLESCVLDPDEQTPFLPPNFNRHRAQQADTETLQRVGVSRASDVEKVHVRPTESQITRHISSRLRFGEHGRNVLAPGAWPSDRSRYRSGTALFLRQMKRHA